MNNINFNNIYSSVQDSFITLADEASQLDRATLLRIGTVALPILAVGVSLVVITKTLHRYNITPRRICQIISNIYSKCFRSQPEDEDIEEIPRMTPPTVEKPQHRLIRTENGFSLVTTTNDQILIHSITDEAMRDHCQQRPTLLYRGDQPRIDPWTDLLNLDASRLIDLLQNIDMPKTAPSPLAIEAPPVIDESPKAGSFVDQIKLEWQAHASDEAKKALRDWKLFKPIKGQNNFDHKNAEILNQINRFLVICYTNVESKHPLIPSVILYNALREIGHIEQIGTIRGILFNVDKFPTNEETKTHLCTTLSQIADLDVYKNKLEELKAHPGLSPKEIKTQYPLVYFTHSLVCALYLEVDLNRFEDLWIENLVPTDDVLFTPPTRYFADWVDRYGKIVDTEAKSSRTWEQIAYIKQECLKGARPLAGYTAASLAGTDPLFHPIDTNNCIQLLSTERHGDKKIACLGLPVPTIDDKSCKSASPVGHMRLLLDHFEISGKVFMSFMHLKIADKKTGIQNWKTAEGMRAAALRELAEKEYLGTYFYFSIPHDGNLFKEPSQIRTNGSGVAADRFDDNSYKYSLVDTAWYDHYNKSGLFVHLKDAVLQNRHGWYFPHELLNTLYGEQLREMYDLPESILAFEGLFDKLFWEVKKTFFADSDMVKSDQWHAFQVLLGVRIIECLSPLSDAFHNTCKDAIDRAAVFLLARRTLNYLRLKNLEGVEFKRIFVDYEKRAVAAKLQGVIPSRHKVAIETLKVMEKVQKVPGDYYPIERDHQSSLFGKEESDLKSFVTLHHDDEGSSTSLGTELQNRFGIPDSNDLGSAIRDLAE